MAVPICKQEKVPTACFATEDRTPCRLIINNNNNSIARYAVCPYVTNVQP